jgi:hypothetical protein
MAYRPASQFFTHASGSALLRHVTSDYRYSSEPAKSWARRSPVRLTDACVGVLAGAVANQRSEPAELFIRYGEGHAGRVLPPLLVTIGKGMARRLRVAGLVSILKQAAEVRTYLSGATPADVQGEGERRLRALYDDAIGRLDIGDVPEDAIRPVVDHLVTMVLAEWAADHADQPPRQVQAPEPEQA